MKFVWIYKGCIYKIIEISDETSMRLGLTAFQVSMNRHSALINHLQKSERCQVIDRQLEVVLPGSFISWRVLSGFRGKFAVNEGDAVTADRR